MADDNEEQYSPEQEQTEDGNVSPSVTRVSFCCPHCGAYAHQEWFRLYGRELGDAKAPTILPVKTVIHGSRGNVNSAVNLGNFNASRCVSCQKYSVWVAEGLVYPPARTGPAPNQDLPGDIKAVYEEARSILSLSPRGAAALLRLCVEMLATHLKAKGATLDKQIEDLVNRGLSPVVQQALDGVRVIGNGAVHPGKMDLNDNPDTAAMLFKLVNLITEKMITDPKHVSEIYGLLTDNQRAAIERRNKKPDPS